jgi:hypothetical protein
MLRNVNYRVLKKITIMLIREQAVYVLRELISVKSNSFTYIFIVAGVTPFDDFMGKLIKNMYQNDCFKKKKK